MFKRILIANRGEIALRIIRACHEMNIEAVAVFSEADRGADYLRQTDRAVCIGSTIPKESYLRMDRIIAAAEVTGADAIHPGYGFLAENAQFAQMCRDCKLEFIGPSADAMRKLGDKASARQIAKAARVPTVPGSDGLVESDEEAVEVAESIGFPVMIKASAGGGGRGMRIARDKTDLIAALKQARQEAAGAFNNDAIYLEKYIDQPRHVEVQIMADQSGAVIHLYERDCTIQRRHQKLIEEAPSPAIDSRTRRDLCHAAVKLAKAAKYTTAGTVEFLVDAKGKFYFIEVNARIQVEHPVTEMLTGIDLIKLQIKAAAGEPLGISQRSVRTDGHVIECRINAEDPYNGFRPCAGRIEKFRPPGGFGVRLDSHVFEGYKVSPYYDSLVGKLIVHQPTRLEAIRAMQRCLREMTVEPIKTTIPFHLRVLEHPRFQAGEIDTGFIERTLL
ncbi:MAG: acetyl-CoA carboxylase biotin carboxylase subunit [Phycisphaerales bacterium]|nr:MAG: acetyl-CoA carboxylase biotin carboxylase subunit [Phycisphaerales bacterium]